MTLKILQLTPDTKAWDEQYAYVKGYILALEDILGDLEQNAPEKLPDTAPSESHAFIEGWTWNLGHVHDHVSLTLTRARATLTAMEEMEDAVQPPQASADQAEAP